MIRKIVNVFKVFGFPVGFYYLVDKVLSRISPSFKLYSYDFVVQPIGSDPLLPKTFVKNLEIREIVQGDPEIERMPIRPGMAQFRFDQNSICLGAFKKGAAIAYMWFCFRSYQEDEIRCNYVLSPSEESVFDFDFYVYPEHRLGIAFLGLWNGANEYLHKLGIKYTYSRVARTNITSSRVHKKLGMKKIGSAVVLKIGSIETMWSSITPRFNLSINKKDRANILLSLGRTRRGGE